MINDEPMTYREKQYRRYLQYLAMGCWHTAQDALWRAASEADMLAPREHSHTELTPARVDELITLLGWE